MEMCFTFDFTVNTCSSVVAPMFAPTRLRTHLTKVSVKALGAVAIHQTFIVTLSYVKVIEVIVGSLSKSADTSIFAFQVTVWDAFVDFIFAMRPFKFRRTFAGVVRSIPVDISIVMRNVFRALDTKHAAGMSLTDSFRHKFLR